MRKRKKVSGEVKTSVTLPRDLWEELKVRSIRENKTLSEVIVEELKEARRIRRLGILEAGYEQGTETLGEEG